MSPEAFLAAAAGPHRVTVLAFDSSNRLAVRQTAPLLDVAFSGDDLATATTHLESSFPTHTTPIEFVAATIGDYACRGFAVLVSGAPADATVVFRSLESLAAEPAKLSAPLAVLLQALEPHLADIPYLHLGENDFIYRFRPAAERNTAIYAQDPRAGGLYQSQLCTAIKALARQHERTATAPVALDFGPIHYVVPSHFGFCLGVKNAIERAYETLAENPGRRVFMLSELIHNPFVNEDLLRRGLRYLQTDRGVPYSVDGQPARMEYSPAAGGDVRAEGGVLLWDTLTSEDIVIIPAFGATDEDKRRLVRKGIAIYSYDATCMLVEKVWKAARTYGREGYTVVIHGKQEHEETKATFSNTRRHAPAVIVRNLEEARQLGEIVASTDPAVRARFYRLFAGRHTPGFDVARHLERIAVVNQTTLLMNETLAIIEHLRGVYRGRFGEETRVGGGGRRDTLCYATQVNQDALARALASPLDAAFVVGGRNSSNTYQLFRLCEQTLGPRAFFIQSEAGIRSLDTVEHYHYASDGGGGTELRPLWPGGPAASPRRVLVTGGASCPDGIIQQVIVRLNSFFPPAALRPIEAVLEDLGVRSAAGGAEPENV